MCHTLHVEQCEAETGHSLSKLEEAHLKGEARELYRACWVLHNGNQPCAEDRRAVHVQQVVHAAVGSH
jgi:hypothetical protein